MTNTLDTLDTLADSLVTALKCSYKHVDRSPIIEESYDAGAYCGGNRDSIWGSVYGSHVTSYPPCNRPSLPPIERSEEDFLRFAMTSPELFRMDINSINELRRTLGYPPLPSGTSITDLMCLFSDTRDEWDII